jgi:hypothetical protein
MNRLANEMGWLVIALAFLIPLFYVCHRLEQRMQGRVGRKSILVELAQIALVIGFVAFVLLWARQR